MTYIFDIVDFRPNDQNVVVTENLREIYLDIYNPVYIYSLAIFRSPQIGGSITTYFGDISESIESDKKKFFTQFFAMNIRLKILDLFSFSLHFSLLKNLWP